MGREKKTNQQVLDNLLVLMKRLRNGERVSVSKEKVIIEDVRQKFVCFNKKLMSLESQVSRLKDRPTKGELRVQKKLYHQLEKKFESVVKEKKRLLDGGAKKSKKVVKKKAKTPVPDEESVSSDDDNEIREEESGKIGEGENRERAEGNVGIQQGNVVAAVGAKEGPSSESPEEDPDIQILAVLMPARYRQDDCSSECSGDTVVIPRTNTVAEKNDEARPNPTPSTSTSGDPATGSELALKKAKLGDAVTNGSSLDLTALDMLSEEEKEAKTSERLAVLLDRVHRHPLLVYE